MRKYIQRFSIILAITASSLFTLNNFAEIPSELNENFTTNDPLLLIDPIPTQTPRPRLSPGVYAILLADEPTPTPTPTPEPIEPTPTPQPGVIRTILAFGDSITYGDETSSHGPSTAYPHYLNDYLGRPYSVVNGGRGKETAVKGSRRLPQLLDEIDPELVLIMEGINDLWWTGHTYETIELNLRVMVDTALSQGRQAIIATLTPSTLNEVNQTIRGFNPYIYCIAEDYHILVAEVYDYITATPNWESLYAAGDGIHPDDEGEQIIAEAFEEQVRKLIN